MFDDTLLDDPTRLVEVDAGGLLRAAAMAGAQVRSCAQMAREAGIAQLEGARHRAILLLTRPGVSKVTSRLLAALLAPVATAPVVLTDTVPEWIGALDLVCAHTDDPGDELLAESIYRAGRYGAQVVVTTPETGPVATAAAGQAIMIPPRVLVPPGFDFARALSAGLVTAKALGLSNIDLELLADELDREAERTHPTQEVFVNPAKSLALRLAEHTPLLWGLDSVGTAVGGYAAFALANHAAQVCHVADYSHAMTCQALRQSVVRAASPDALFQDPDERSVDQVRVFLLAIGMNHEVEVARSAALNALPDADLLAPAEEVSGGDAVGAAVLALRFEMAALYSGLALEILGTQGRSEF